MVGNRLPHPHEAYQFPCWTRCGVVGGSTLCRNGIPMRPEPTGNSKFPRRSPMYVLCMIVRLVGLDRGGVGWGGEGPV